MRIKFPEQISVVAPSQCRVLCWVCELEEFELRIMMTLRHQRIHKWLCKKDPPLFPHYFSMYFNGILDEIQLMLGKVWAVLLS